jgi:hypothetical protein
MDLHSIVSFFPKLIERNSVHDSKTAQSSLGGTKCWKMIGRGSLKVTVRVVKVTVQYVEWYHHSTMQSEHGYSSIDEFELTDLQFELRDQIRAK